MTPIIRHHLVATSNAGATDPQSSGAKHCLCLTSAVLKLFCQETSSLTGLQAAVHVPLGA